MFQLFVIYLVSRNERLLIHFIKPTAVFRCFWSVWPQEKGKTYTSFLRKWISICPLKDFLISVCHCLLKIFGYLGMILSFCPWWSHQLLRENHMKMIKKIFIVSLDSWKIYAIRTVLICNRRKNDEIKLK